jgi:hypothetical protein
MEFESSIMLDDGFEDKSTRDPEERPEEAEAIEDEIDLETDTEHELQGAEDQTATDEMEEEEADEVKQTFGPNPGVDERIRERMNQLAAILKRRRVTENPIAERREQAEVQVIPANSDRATQVWKASGRMLTDRQLGDMRLMPDSPLEGLLQILRGRASASPSRETSALVSEMEFEPSIISDDGFEGKSTRDSEERPEEAEAIEDEIDLETDTKHEMQGAKDQGATDEAEGEEADEVEQACERNPGVDERIRERMN